MDQNTRDHLALAAHNLEAEGYGLGASAVRDVIPMIEKLEAERDGLRSGIEFLITGKCAAEAEVQRLREAGERAADQLMANVSIMERVEALLSAIEASSRSNY